MVEFKVYSIEPSNNLIYSFEDPMTHENLLFDATTLARLEPVPITGYSEIPGVISDRFGVNPTVITYANHSSQVVYFLKEQTVDSSGQIADVRNVISKVHLKIPDLVHSNMTLESTSLVPLPLAGVPEEKPKVVAVPEMVSSELEELRAVVRALTQQLYQILPVDLPKTFRVDGKKAKMISFEELEKREKKGEIMDRVWDPMLQPFAGSHRSSDRMLTCYSQRGEIYLVPVRYDPKTGVMSAPKETKTVSMLSPS